MSVRDAAGQTASGTGPTGSDAFYPQFHGVLDLQVELDKQMQTNSVRDASINTYTDSRLRSSAVLTPFIQIDSTLHIYQVKEQEQTSWFAGEGLFIEELNLKLTNGPASLFAGKFNPRFGISWAAAPGVYGDNFSYYDYRLTEADGVGGTYALDAGSAGRHEVYAAAWFKDNTLLSSTLGAQPSFGAPTTIRPGRMFPGTGGPANSRNLQSGSLSVRGGEIAALPHLVYNIDFTTIAPGSPFFPRQFLVAAGLQYKQRIGKKLYLKPIVEFVQMENGTVMPLGPPLNRRYLTAGAELDWRQWSVSAVWGQRQLSASTLAVAPSPAARDLMYTASAGYQFANGIEAQVGLLRQKVQGNWTNTVGGLIHYVWNF